MAPQEVGATLMSSRYVVPFIAPTPLTISTVMGANEAAAGRTGAVTLKPGRCPEPGAESPTGTPVSSQAECAAKERIERGAEATSSLGTGDAADDSGKVPAHRMGTTPSASDAKKIERSSHPPYRRRRTRVAFRGGVIISC
jgi:hypothetical protein